MPTKKAVTERDKSHDVSISPAAIKWAIGAVGGVLVALGAWFVVKDRVDASLQAPLKAHQKHDESIQAWNQFGFADTRAQFLADHKFECDAKKMMGKMSSVDSAVCARYDQMLSQKQTEAAQLKSKAMETTKE